MEVIGSVVDRKVILLAIELELTTANAVAVAAHQGRKERFGGIDAVVDIVVSLNHVGQFATAVRHHDSDNRAAIVGDSYFVTFDIAKQKQVYFFSADLLLKVGGLESAC